MKVSDLPYLSHQHPGFYAAMKGDYEDFLVEEVPLYLPCGEGEHVYVRIEKRGLATQRALREIAKALGVRPRDVGYAGQKDARGVTVQTFSFHGVEPAAFEKLDIARMRVLDVTRHKNKLRLGHLAGTRFAIRLREVAPEAEQTVTAVLEQLGSRGVPNYYGAQRFGLRGDTGRVGRELVCGNHARAAALIAGSPQENEADNLKEARRLFDEGDYETAARMWPRGFEECRSVCHNMKRFSGDAERAVMSLESRTLGFYISAYQSEMFNRVLAERLETMHLIEDGDLAWLHRNGAVFTVEDAGAEQERADTFEISPSGPMYGKKMTCAGGEPGAREQAVLEAEGLTLDELPTGGPLKMPGARRPLRIPFHGYQVTSGSDERGDFLCLNFTLPPGTYATAVLREVCKEGLTEVAWNPRT